MWGFPDKITGGWAKCMSIIEAGHRVDDFSWVFIIWYLHVDILKRNDQTVSKAIPIRVVSIGVVYKCLTDTGDIDRGLR